MVSERVIPPGLGNECFLDVSKDIPIFVPKGTVAAYKAASGWSEFTKFVSVKTSDWSVPTANDAVYVDASFTLATDVTVIDVHFASTDYTLTIPNGKTLTVTGSLNATIASQIVVEDGGQLIHSNSVYATVKKDILGHQGNNNIGWNFIATPIATGTTPSINNELMNGTPENYDLYYYDEPAHYWRNHKLHPIDILSNGKGYLYASHDAAELTFEGILQAGQSDGNGNYIHTVQNLSHSATELTGFNLVGNPFACNATINRPAYVINGKYVVAFDGGQKVIPPCEGVMVQADAEHESVTFTKVIPAAQSAPTNPGSLQIALTETNMRGKAMLDNAIVSFNEGSQLGKFYFSEQNANIYIPQGSQDYAITYSEGQGEMPLNFKAKENGTYTLTVNPEGMEMGYLHLIDNYTGTDIDLLSTPDYTFYGKTTDYASRFKLVFDAAGNNDVSDESFAFIRDGNIVIINSETSATLQIIDVTGRVIVSRSGHIQCVPTSGMPAGVYVLRLLSENGVKTQKITVAP